MASSKTLTIAHFDPVNTLGQMAKKPWDGDRPLTPRIVLEKKTVNARGLAFTFATEQISAPTDWCSVDENHHLMYVYRHGAMRSMKTLLDWGPSGQVPPSAGDIWWKPAGIPCAALVQGDVARYCEIGIPGRAIGDTTLLPRVKYKDLLVHHLVEEIYSVAGRDDAVARLLTDSLAETIRLSIVDTCTAPQSRKPQQRTTLDATTRAAIVAYLSDSLDSDITLDALAELAEMPVSTFNQAFRRCFHTTPYQFVLERRIARAQTLLLTTALSIGDIAAKVGFSNRSHFATAFKRRVGVSPSEFRAKG
ncbi:Transcriptional regulator, AraC family [Mycolicibacterium fortuitum]|uniref:Transcriptional regulator, AraC family n=2 Tax=Mycolicibacterium fortuitum TaxID=1766 RepID=A0A0N9XJF3_MYCFO|nr:Transcriptional regulator, AraC family [Mycolicibacterium fortuitum]